MFRKIQTSDAPAAIGPYSQAIAAGNVLYTSGQIPLDPVSQKMVEGGIAEQTKRAIQNLQAVLEAGGAGLDTIIKTTCFLADMQHFQPFNEIYAQYFAHGPARSCVAVKELPKGALVEIEAVALLR